MSIERETSYGGVVVRGDQVIGVVPRGRRRVLGLPKGGMNAGETPQQTAAREVREECGLELGRLDFAGLYMASPGATSERVHAYVGEVAAPGQGGIHGLADEHEDIRVEIVAAAHAIRLLDEGVIEAGPAVVALAWFARHRDRLRREWQRPGR